MRRSAEEPRSGRATAAAQRRALRRLLRGLPDPVPPPALLPRTLAEVRRLQARWMVSSRRRRPAVPVRDNVGEEIRADVPVDVPEERDDVAQRRLA